MIPRFSIPATLALSSLAAPVAAQTGRSVELNVSPTLGAVSSYTARYPVAAAGRIGAYGMTLPFASAVPLALPGITSNGLVRIDLANILVQGVWLLDGTGAFTWTVPVPNAPVFQGLSFDVQTLDVDLAVTDFAWGDNELSLTIGPATIAVAPNMLWVPAGTFQIGSPVTPLGVAPYFNQAQSQPVHSVTITQPFWIGKYEVTQAEYQAVMGTNPSFFAGAQRPVEQVSWNNAMAYCAALTATAAWPRASSIHSPTSRSEVPTLGTIRSLSPTFPGGTRTPCRATRSAISSRTEASASSSRDTTASETNSSSTFSRITKRSGTSHCP